MLTVLKCHHIPVRQTVLTVAITLVATFFAINLTGCPATAPALKTSPSDVNFGAAFGDVAVGTTSAASTVQLSNTGTADLNVTSLTVTGANADDFLLAATSLPLQIPSGASVDVAVMCKPTAEGARTAALSIESNTPDGTAMVSLTAKGTVTVPKAQLSPVSLDFGTVAVGQSSSKTFTVANVGTQTLQTSNIQITGAQAAAFTSNDADWYTLAPGISSTFTVTFKPTAAGPATAQIEVTSNDPAGKVILPLTGLGSGTSTASLPLLQLSPDSVWFGSIAVGTASTASTIRLNNTGTAVLNVSSLALSGANTGDFLLSTPTMPLQIAAGASASVSVVCKPTAVGVRAATLAIGSNSSGGTGTVSLSGQGAAAASPKAQLAPTALAFGSVAVGQSVSKTFTVLSVGTQTLQTSNIQITGAQAAAFTSNDADWYTLVPGISTTFTVTFKPTAVGAANAQIEVFSNDPAGKTVLPLTGAGTGTTTQPLLKVSPASVSFGSVAVGTTSAASTLQLSNTGTAALSVTALTLTGTNAAEFVRSTPTLPLQIAAGASASVSLTFKPAASGTRSASLTVASNNPAGNVAVTLSGTGTVSQPQLKVSPASVTFGNIAVGATSPASTIQLNNTGTAALSITALTLAGTNAAEFVRSTPALPLQLAAGASANISLTFKPAASGARSATLAVASNNPAGNVAVTLTGTATVTQPALQVSPASVSFGNLAVGTTSAASTVQLNNTGTAALSVTALTMSGANAAEFTLSAPTLPLQIAAGASSSVSLKFKPAASGSRSASLTIASNNPSGNVAVTLSGTGAAATTSGYPNDGSVLGTNLGTISDWNPEWAFVDCFKTSRAWESAQLWGSTDTRTLSLDANGWVTSLQANQVARTLLFWGQVNTYPSGDYVVLYNGSGTLNYTGAATKVSGTAGRDVVRVDASKGGWQLVIAATTPGDYIRDIRVIMPGGRSTKDPYSWYADAASCPYGDYKSFEDSYQTQIFHPIFLNTIKKYKVLRFTDWMATYDSKQVNWTDRPKLTDARWSIKGAPVEVMCSLANTIHADPWFNLPHLATDDYLTQFATVLRDQLAPDLHAHLEYSNETWNGDYPQAAYCRQQGVAMGLNPESEYAAGACYSSLRSVQMFTIFERVLGGTARLKRVLATQAAGWYFGEMKLSYNNAYQHADLLAIAPYFGSVYGSPDNAPTTQAMTLDQLFASLYATELPDVYTWIQANANLATKYGVELVAYEGGQSLIGYYGTQDNETLIALYTAANRDPRMTQLYTSYLNAWKSHGGGLFIHYQNCLNYTKWGCWGSLERLDQDPSTAPKYAALQQFIEDNR